MERINKLISSKIQKLNNTKSTFKDLFNIIHDQDDRVFGEYLDGYRIKKVSYKECKENCIKMGNVLLDRLSDLEKGQFIGLLMDNSLLWIYSFWGLLMAGYKPMLLNKRLNNKLNQEIIDTLSIKMILSDSDVSLDCAYEIMNVEHINSVNSLTDHFIWANELAISTSATSLNVKICVYDGESIGEQIINTKSIVKENPMIKKHYKGSIKMLTFLPFYHIFGLVATYMWFAFFGRTFVFLKDFGTDTILKTIRKHEVTHVFAVPMLWHGIHREIIKQVNLMDEKTQKKFNKGIKLSLAIQNAAPKLGKRIASKLFKEVQDKVFGNSIEFMITGGGYILPEALKIINAIGYPLYNGYGMSEIGITSVELRLKPKYRLLGTIGKPFKSNEYRIAEDGTLLVKGTSLCKRIITKNETIDIDNNEWFNTTDIVTCDKKGYYYISGRKDDVVISSNGEKINPDLLEKAIFIPSVNRFSILGYNGQLSLILEIQYGLNPLAIKRLDDEVEIALANLKKQNYSIERVYFTFDPIAAPTAIKVSRSILLKYISDGNVSLKNYSEYKDFLITDDNEMVNELENKIKEIMGKILNINYLDINPNAHFILDLGGSSLDYLTLLVKIKEEYEIELSSEANNSFYTARGLASYIALKNK